MSHDLLLVLCVSMVIGTVASSWWINRDEKQPPQLRRHWTLVNVWYALATLILFALPQWLGWSGASGWKGWAAALLIWLYLILVVFILPLWANRRAAALAAGQPEGAAGK